MREESFRDVVEEKWTAASGPIDVLVRLKVMHDGIHMWDQQVLRKPKKQLRQAQRELEVLMRG
jgi:hypothetical protein